MISCGLHYVPQNISYLKFNPQSHMSPFRGGILDEATEWGPRDGTGDFMRKGREIWVSTFALSHT
jgi:hypothetical protein